MLWEIDIHPDRGQEGCARQPDRAAERVATSARELGLAENLQVATARGFLLQGAQLNRQRVERLATELLADTVVEQFGVGQPGDAELNYSPLALDSRPSTLDPTCVTVLLKPGVMDPVAQSVLAAASDIGVDVDAAATFRKYWLSGANHDEIQAVANRLLANDAIEQVVFRPLKLDRIELGHPYRYELRTVAIRERDDDALMRLSRESQLYLQLAEMQAIRERFRELGRDPTDAELETLAQTWSEHCSHKTLAGRIAYRDEHGERQFENMLKETIFAATRQIRARLGADDWCVSVFEDNAGVVQFDEQYNLAFKVETHNHPSALEPYGGANTGIGGVIRDIMGTGLGAKPIASTDVFCFAPPVLGQGSRVKGQKPEANSSLALNSRPSTLDPLPPGVLHPRRVMRGVVEGVRDYGNRMGIPTVNGAVFFDERYLGNPLVYCGNIGLLPVDKSHKKPEPGDLIVAIGGRTGRDGIHGATFSSAELTSHSEQISGGAVQIGNAIEEKRVLDVLLAARDRGLYHAVTDCGAGGFSSAVGEMGEHIGAEVHLDRVPLKYEGLSYTEIWISEAQERMVLAVPEQQSSELEALCRSENVEATTIGRFVPTGRLRLLYNGHEVADLDMQFLHKGRPPVVRQAVYEGPGQRVKSQGPESNRLRLALDSRLLTLDSYNSDLFRILASPNVASKEWIVRQYDHEILGGSVVKPFVGAANDGPSDAAVIRPVLSSRRGVAIACGMNPRYGEFDPYHMAASAIDEAVRNCVAVGADPRRIAILDNFCWGDCERPEALGALVRAAIACHDVSIVLGTPFISGKDSLNNEFSYTDTDGMRRTIAIPPSLLISALGQIDDVSRCVTMDLKQPGSLLYLVGETRDELGGSHFALVNQLAGGQVPTVDAERARDTFMAVHRAIGGGLVRACHDLSEGGLAVAAAEMAFAGGHGAQLEVGSIATGHGPEGRVIALFSESNSRFLCEVAPEYGEQFEQVLNGISRTRVGYVTAETRLVITSGGRQSVNADIFDLKEAWQATFRW
jgi:phosphoribosylformylglycinamidine synthase